MASYAGADGSSNSQSYNHFSQTSKKFTACISPMPLKGTYTACGDVKFNMKEHQDDVFEMLQFMRKNNYLTDVKLKIGKEVLTAHKLVLAASSPYFKAMFIGGLMESEQDTVNLQGVSSVIMSRLLCFMYSGEIVVNEKTVCQLLSASTMFQINPVVKACCAFLEQQLDACNAIGIADFARQHGCMDLYKKSNTFIEQHFSEVAEEEEFLLLSDCQLVDLISRDTLNVPDEKDVYYAVLKWVMYDEATRHPKMERILQAVRCHFLSPRFLCDQMKNCHILQKLPACRQYLAKIFKDLSLHKPPEEKGRSPNAPCIIYIVGGYSNRKSLDSLECYDLARREWTQLSKLPVARSGLGAAHLYGLFYALGGRKILSNGSYHDCSWVDSFDPVTNEWRQRAPMNYPRNRLGVIVLDGQIYSVGGANGSNNLNSVEKYDPETNMWTLIKPMSKARMAVGIGVVNRLLYAVGGFDGHERLNSVECYHPEKNVWNFVTSMKVQRSGAGVCSIENYIFVIGGYDGERQLSSVEIYDTETDTWSYAPPLKIPRSAMTVSVWDKKIYVMGGYDGNAFLSSVEIYDFRKSVWTDGEPLPWGRSGHAAATCLYPCILHHAESK